MGGGEGQRRGRERTLLRLSLGKLRARAAQCGFHQSLSLDLASLVSYLCTWLTGIDLNYSFVTIGDYLRCSFFPTFPLSHGRLRFSSRGNVHQCVSLTSPQTRLSSCPPQTHSPPPLAHPTDDIGGKLSHRRGGGGVSSERRHPLFPYIFPRGLGRRRWKKAE